MSKSHLDRFFEDMRISVDRAVGKMLATIDVEKSKCFKVEDKERIFEAVRLTVGFSGINSMIFERLRKWMLEVTQQAISKETEALGAKHPDTFTSLGILARLYENMGDYTRALPLYEDCLKNDEEVLGAKHPDTLLSLNNLAELFYKQGDYSRAQSLYEDCLRKREEVLGAKHPHTRESRNLLAIIYEKLGKHDLASQLRSQS